jgi:CBS-domain-containing membrane protein
MKVEDIMTTDVISVQPGTSLIEVAKLLKENKIHSLPVIDGKRHLVGIVTEMDFFVKDAASSYLPQWIELMGQIKEGSTFSLKEQEKLDYVIDLRVEDIMTAEVKAVGPDTYVKELMDIFKETRFKTFPVVDRNKALVGIISLVDVIKSIEV